MTKKKIIEGNRLITQFMDWELIQTKDELKAWVFKNKKTKRVILLDDSEPYNKKFWNKDSVLEFHTSWDTLMPVVKKILESLIGNVDDWTFKYERRIKDALLATNIDDVWKWSAEYIKTYYRNKK